jgi:subtilisin family serine protease
MACPHVAGAAALLWSYVPAASAAQVWVCWHAFLLSSHDFLIGDNVMMILHQVRHGRQDDHATNQGVRYPLRRTIGDNVYRIARGNVASLKFRVSRLGATVLLRKASSRIGAMSWAAILVCGAKQEH